MSRNLLQHCGYTHNTAAPVVSDIKFFLDASVENAMVKERDTGVPGLGAHIGRGYYQENMILVGKAEIKREGPAYWNMTVQSLTLSIIPENARQRSQ